MGCSTTPRKEGISTSRLPEKPDVLVAKRHHLLVRWSHWLNVPNPSWPHFERHLYLLGVTDLSTQVRSAYWVYNHLSLGPGMLAPALRLHWLCAYSFVLNGAVYVAGLISGGGWRGLLPRRTDLLDAFKIFRYYIGFPLAKLTHRQWLHPSFNTKYNALQRTAYFSVPIAGFLSITTGWAIHKPMQFHSLAAIFGGFD